MKRLNLVFVGAALAGLASTAIAQSAVSTRNDSTPSTVSSAKTVTSAMSAEEQVAASPYVPPIEFQYYRAEDQRGINVFESPKAELVPYQGFKFTWGGAFTQQYQGLDHSNTASPNVVNGVDANKLIQIGHGFNNAVANLYLNAQLAPGIRMATTMYASARHHNETWVKDGYMLMDASPIDWQPLHTLMKYVTMKIGDFEINYGDTHFRRTDNGNAMRNPLVGNYIMDAFTNEIGTEIYVRQNGFMFMTSVTDGENHGYVTVPGKRSPSYINKIGFDKQFNSKLRFRLTGSTYATAKSVSNTLYSGDRGGSRYYDVLENTASTETAQAWSGAIQPGIKNSVHAVVINPFIKYQGLELYGNLERVRGRNAGETSNREFHQYVGEATYRFAPMNKLFVVGRYNKVNGRLLGFASDITVNRTQFGGGWFVTPNAVMKFEAVRQNYLNFPTTDIRNGGKFQGFMIESTVAF